MQHEVGGERIVRAENEDLDRERQGGAPALGLLVLRDHGEQRVEPAGGEVTIALRFDRAAIVVGELRAPGEGSRGSGRRRDLGGDRGRKVVLPIGLEEAKGAPLDRAVRSQLKYARILLDAHLVTIEQCAPRPALAHLVVAVEQRRVILSRFSARAGEHRKLGKVRRKGTHRTSRKAPQTGTLREYSSDS